MRQRRSARADAAAPVSSLPHRALRGLVDLVAPPKCAACDTVLGARPERGPELEGFCGACAPLVERVPSSSKLGVAYVYGGPLADAIRRFKYGGQSELCGALGRLLAIAALELSGSVDLVVPVPLHARRLRERGFDQTALLCGPVARALGARCAVEGLVRARPTAVQASLARAHRVDNVRGAFVATRVVAGARVLCVDDVRTTGATLGEACAALARGGAVAVHPLALAGVEAGAEDDGP